MVGAVNPNAWQVLALPAQACDACALEMKGVSTFMTGLSAKKEGSTIGKDDLIHQVAAKAESSLKETGKVIDAFTEIVREEVAKGKEVRLMGFGTWNLRNVAARKVKSIRGGNQITIPARKRVGFSVGAVLSQAADPQKAKAATTKPGSPTASRKR